MGWRAGKAPARGLPVRKAGSEAASEESFHKATFAPPVPFVAHSFSGLSWPQGAEPRTESVSHTSPPVRHVPIALTGHKKSRGLVPGWCNGPQPRGYLPYFTLQPYGVDTGFATFRPAFRSASVAFTKFVAFAMSPGFEERMSSMPPA